MTQDEIIRLAEEAGVHEGGKENWVAGNRWEDFAKLVAAKEREECAQIAQQKISKTWAAPNSPKKWWELACENIATAIRARGQA